MNNIIICLSFDCDTPEDALAAATLQKQLNLYGFNINYAVPGQELERNADIYRRIASEGGVFLNHGMAPHAEKRGNQYHPITFYKDWNDEEVIEDMNAAHQTIIKITGQTPAGFRTPHFGNFQTLDQRKLIRNISKQLGYQYTSDTLPNRAFQFGPLFKIEDIYEIPLLSSYDEPSVLLDSYSYLDDRIDFKLSEKYFSLFKNTIDFFHQNKFPALLNFYIDPAHVTSTPYFLELAKIIHQYNIPCITYENLINQLGERSPCVASQAS